MGGRRDKSFPLREYTVFTFLSEVTKSQKTGPLWIGKVDSVRHT